MKTLNHYKGYDLSDETISLDMEEEFWDAVQGILAQ